VEYEKIMKFKNLNMNSQKGSKVKSTAEFFSCFFTQKFTLAVVRPCSGRGFSHSSGEFLTSSVTKCARSGKYRSHIATWRLLPDRNYAFLRKVMESINPQNTSNTPATINGAHIVIIESAKGKQKNQIIHDTAREL
jgi:hypothetical protein